MRLQTAYYECPDCKEVVPHCFYTPPKAIATVCGKTGQNVLLQRVRKPT